MSGSSGADAPASDGAVNPFTRQQNYNFSGHVLLTAVVILLVLTVVFVLIRILLYKLVVRPGGGRRSLAAGILRSINSFSRSGRHGLDASALSALPVTSYRKGDGSTRGAAGADCAVCLSELEDGEKARELPNCGHVFHVECVDAWLRSRTTCPLCRAEAEPKVKGKGKAEAAQSSSATAPPPRRCSAPGEPWS